MDERITLEDLQNNLRQRTEEQEAVLDSLKSMFADADFEFSEEKNTIDFTDTHKYLKALFSIDNSTFRYTCYITAEDDKDKSFNFSLKGEIDDIEDAAQKFLAEFNDLLTLNIEAPADEAEDEVVPEDAPDEE